MKKTFALLAFAACTTSLSAQPPRGPQPRPVLLALDTDHDGILSAAEIAAAPKVLLALDTNGDGALTQDEFFPRPTGMGASPEETVSLLMSFDKNGDGALTKDEVPERMQGIFRRGDRNHDGKLTAEEIKAMATREGLPSGPVKAGTASGMLRQDALITVLDANHDGVIDATEIANSAAALLSLDKDGDGKLSPEEIKVRQSTPEERVDHMLEEWDTNKDGKIAKDEAPERMAEQWSKYDLNGDGFLDKAELTTMFANMGNTMGRPAGEGRPNGNGPQGEGRRNRSNDEGNK